MSRRRVAVKRPVMPDPKYKSVMVTMLVNVIMQHGKKSLAFKTVYAAFDHIGKQLQNRFKEEQPLDLKDEVKEKIAGVAPDQVPLVVFNQCLENIQPVVEVKAHRVGGSTCQIPQSVPQARRLTLALRFLKKATISRRKSVQFIRTYETMMVQLLALEIIDAYEGKGVAFKMCQDMHRMAKANQQNAHFRLSFRQSK